MEIPLIIPCAPELFQLDFRILGSASWACNMIFVDFDKPKYKKKKYIFIHIFTYVHVECMVMSHGI